MGDMVNTMATDPMRTGGPGNDPDLLPETSLPAEALCESPVDGSSFCSRSALAWTAGGLGCA